jgi:uncharacterized Tic20 family protein
MNESDEKLWGTLAHIGVPFFGFLSPLIVWLIQKDKSAFVKAESTEALNFGILVTIAYVVSSVLTVVTFGLGSILYFVVWVVALIFCIQGVMANQKGANYKYPFNWRIVK